VTLDRARELLKVQAGFGGSYNANGARLILAEVGREHGQGAVDGLIRELDLERVFGFKLSEQLDERGVSLTIVPRAGAELSAAAVASRLRYMLPDLEKT
jgi:hypothetical protein